MMCKIKAISAFCYILIALPFGILLMYLFNGFQRKIRHGLARTFLGIFRIRAYVSGSLDPTAQILIMNHQSFMDVIYFEAIHPNDLCWIAKRELGEYFLYGHALKAPKMILIDRESKRESVSLIKEAKDRLDRGRTLCIFPEGTRSQGGEKLLPFKNGAKILVEHFRLKVQPIILCNTRACLDVSAVSFSNSPFYIKYLPAFLPQGEQWYEHLKEQMQSEYSKMYLEVR